MNTEIKRKWISALMGGEYKQTKGTLRRDNCFCAYGVLCDLYAKEKNEKWILNIGYSGRYSFLGMWDFVPDEVLEWAGLSESDKVYRKGITEKNIDRVSMMNDKGGKSFSEIADFIEEGL